MIDFTKKVMCTKVSCALQTCNIFVTTLIDISTSVNLQRIWLGVLG